MANKYSVKLLRKEQVTRDTWLFSFAKPKGYAFTPGQYQTFTLSLPNGKTDWRDMTITSSPHQDELWLVTKVRKDHSEFKDQLQKLSVGSSITLEGPSGGFTIRDKNPHVFLAGGIGVNVFHSILMDAAEKDKKISMTLLVSFSKKEDMLFYETLKRTENDKRKIIYSLTQENWEGEKGRITHKMIKKHVQNFRDSIFMIAGGQDFVDSMYEILITAGVGKEKIRIDYFTGY